MPDDLMDGPWDEEWPEPESGMLTGYVGTVVDAWFAANERFGGTQLNLKQTTDSPSSPEWTEQINCGDQWESFDGGITIENKENADKANVHANSRYGEFQAAIMAIVPREILKGKGGPLNAKTYMGLTFKWSEVKKEYSVKDKVTGEQKTGVSSYNMPSAYLGEGAVTSSAAPSATSSSGLDGVDDALAASIREAKAASTTHSEFVDKAISLTGVVGNDMLVKAIADENGLWKELG